MSKLGYLFAATPNFVSFNWSTLTLTLVQFSVSRLSIEYPTSCPIIFKIHDSPLLRLMMAVNADLIQTITFEIVFHFKSTKD